MDKMATRTCYKFYEFFIMPFGLCNASMTFVSIMNLVIHSEMNICVVVFIHNTMVFPKNEHDDK